MTRPTISRCMCVAVVVLFVLCGTARAGDPTETQEALASHFRTAPEAVPPQMQLVQIVVNGVDAGLHQIIVSSGSVLLPASTLAALRLVGVAGDPIALAGRADIGSQFDEAKSVLNLTVPVSMLGPYQLNLTPAGLDLTLSPETWGTYANY